MGVGEGGSGGGSGVCVGVCAEVCVGVCAGVCVGVYAGVLKWECKQIKIMIITKKEIKDIIDYFIELNSVFCVCKSILKHARAFMIP